MNYDKEFWDKYANENESKFNEEFAKFETKIEMKNVKTLFISLGYASKCHYQ